MKKTLFLVLFIAISAFAFSCESFELMNEDKGHYKCIGFSKDLGMALFPTTSKKIFAYYPTGELMLVADFKRGIQWGKTVTYYKDGTLRESRSYSADVLDGPDVIFGDNGKPIVITDYAMGEAVKTTGFNPDGTTSFVQKYVDGKLHCIIYYVQNEIIKTCTQVSDNSIETAYYADGEICDIFEDDGKLMTLVAAKD